MIYRELGKTGIKVGEIGLGCEHLDRKPYHQVKETIDEAHEQGVNVYDVFMPGKEVRENIAKALGGRRRDAVLLGHIGSSDINQQYDISRDMSVVTRYFEDLLRVFGGYIDFGMMFFIDSEEDYRGVFDTEFATYVERLKRQGDIRHIGFSSHNPETAIKVIQTGLPEMMLFSINPAFDMLPHDSYVFDHFEKGFGAELFRGIDPKRAELYKLCEQQGIGITVMKALGGGKLISPEHTPFAKPLTPAQCVNYALSRPAVSSVMLGCKSAAEMRDSMRYYTVTDSERDYTDAILSLRNDFRGNCVYCGHCQPCPAGIDIVAVNKYLDIARLNPDTVPPSISSHYLSLDSRGDKCTNCGNCEARCPFGVPIAANMREADALFGGK